MGKAVKVKTEKLIQKAAPKPDPKHPTKHRQAIFQGKEKIGNMIFKKNYLAINCHLVLKLALYVIITDFQFVGIWDKMGRYN